MAEHLDEIEYAYRLRAEAEEGRRGAAGAPTWDELLDEVGITPDELQEMPTELDQGDD